MGHIPDGFDQDNTDGGTVSPDGAGDGAHLADRLLSLPNVEVIVGMSAKTIRRLIAQERFPSGVAVSDRLRMWRLSDIRSWMADPLGWVSF